MQKINFGEEKEYYSHMKKLFSTVAPFYDFLALPLFQIRNKVVNFANARNGSKILDAATGTGKQAFAFGKKGFDVVGIDISESMLKVAKKKNKYPNVRFEIADAANLPFGSKGFDVSCVSFALHEMPFAIRKRVIKEIFRVTKNNGVIIIADYALPKNKILGFLSYNFLRLFEKYYPEFIKENIKEMLTESGIDVVEELPVLFGSARIWKGIKIKI